MILTDLRAYGVITYSTGSGKCTFFLEKASRSSVLRMSLKLETDQSTLYRNKRKRKSHKNEELLLKKKKSKGGLD